jgi:hypothetical protein
MSHQDQVNKAKLLAALLCAEGFKIEIDTGGESYDVYSSDFSQVADHIAQADEEEWIIHHRFADNKIRRLGWIKIVWGNEDDELFADYTEDLTEYLTTYEKAWVSLGYTGANHMYVTALRQPLLNLLALKAQKANILL